MKTEVCARLGKGEPLASICRTPGFPAVRTVSLWKAEDAEFDADFARAREEGFEAIAPECLEIADDLSDEPHSRRVRVDPRLRLLAKWHPSRYGDQVGRQEDETPETLILYHAHELAERADGRFLPPTHRG